MPGFPVRPGQDDFISPLARKIPQDLETASGFAVWCLWGNSSSHEAANEIRSEITTKVNVWSWGKLPGPSTKMVPLLLTVTERM